MFFGIVFVLWLVEQGSPPPSFHCWCHAVVKGGGEEVWELSDGSVAFGCFFFLASCFFLIPQLGKVELLNFPPYLINPVFNFWYVRVEFVPPYFTEYGENLTVQTLRTGVP